MTMKHLLAGALALFALPAAAEYVDPPVLAHSVAEGALPPVAERLPQEPLVVNMAAKGRKAGRHGGELRTIFTRSKDIRYMVVYGYARLVGYDHNYELKPDLLKDVSVQEGRIFTLTLRRGHKWSDGAPFTTEDFRYWWEDVANNPDLAPSGPPELMLVDGQKPKFEVLDEVTLRLTWDKPNPRLLPTLAQARPPFIYRPAHYMKQFHGKYTDADSLKPLMEKKKARSWAQLHNKFDNMYKNDNPDLPTLQPWVNQNSKNGQRYVNRRNPFFHRVDENGLQLPYIDTVEVEIAAGGLVASKVTLGEADLQVRSLTFSDAPVLKKGEKTGGYKTHVWANGAANEIALYPNLNYVDPGFRALFRDVRFRRALSMAIDRRLINKLLFFGLAKERAVAALERSPFYDEAQATAWTVKDIDGANALLDEMGLTDRDGDDTRLLPDGRRLEIVIESAGERKVETDALGLIAETWKEIGVRLIHRPLDRDILRNAAYQGKSMMPVWFGWNNGLPTADAAPLELAPVDQANFSWPMWGQHFQTKGSAGEAPDMDAPRRLLRLFQDWTAATDMTVKQAIWREMLGIHADQVFAIGTISQAPQPMIASARLANVPAKAIYAWDPGAHLGVHRMDEFFFTE